MTLAVWAEVPADFVMPPHEMDYIDSVELQVNDEDTFYLARMHEIWVYPSVTDLLQKETDKLKQYA